jgi:DNA-binding PadR family transcriptional regulator
MSQQGALGQFEQVVLTTIVDLADMAYGVTIHRAVGELSRPRSVSLGAVYATLDRLEDKGLVASWLSDPTPERGGRSRRHYRLEPAGMRALHESVLVAKRICQCIEIAWGATIWNTGPA